VAHAEFNVVSSDPCENTQRRRDGAYLCNIHHLTGSGIKRTRLAMGNTNPYEETWPDLAAELRTRIAGEYKFIDSAEKVPLESFVGLSIIRMCARDEHVDARNNQNYAYAPRAERVASVAFVKDPNDVVEVELPRTAHQKAVSENGIGSLRWIGGSLTKVLYLPITPAERGYPVEFAITALAGSGRASDPHLALHSIPSGTGFVEQIVALDELQ